ncbi:MAG: hypothetical protein L6V35_03190 [Alistipes putredinis]|nr:MAG: hypothetical protein L6V35_03190 [Alistipes putredinis]
MSGKIDVAAETAKLNEELKYFEGFLASVLKKLGNERFVSSAPEKVVANERAKQADAEAKIKAIKRAAERIGIGYLQKKDIAQRSSFARCLFSYLSPILPYS